MASLATAFVTIRPDTTGFGARLSKSVSTDAGKAGEKAGKSLSSKFGGALKVGSLLAGAFAVTQGISFFKDMISEATEAQKVGAQTAAVLKSTGGAANISAAQVGNLATAISNKVGIDDEAIQSGANLLLTFKNIRNEGGKGNDIFNQTTSIMTDMAAAMGKEPKDAAIQLGKALNDPVKGISALSRVGVTFDEGQKKQIKRMVESGNTMGAQKIILRELNSEFKGSAEAQATPAEKAAVAWGNFKEMLGTAVLPIVAKVASFLSEKVIPAMTQFFQEMQHGTGAGGRFAGIMRQIGAAVVNVGQFLVDHRKMVAALAGVYVLVRGAMVAYKVQQAASLVLLKAHTVGTIENTVVTKAASAASKAWAAAQWLLNAALTANPIGIVIAALVALGVGLVVAYKKSETFRRIVDGAFSGVKDVAKAVTGWFADKFVPFFTHTLPNAFGATKSWVKRNWPVILAILAGPVGLAVLAIAKHWDKITGAFKAARDWAKGAFKTSWNGVKGVLMKPVDDARDLIKKLFGSGGPVRTAFSNVKDWVKGAWKSAWNTIKGTVMAPLEGAKVAIRVMLGAGGAVRTAFSNVKDWVKGAWKATWNGIKAVLLKPVQDARDAIQNIFGRGGPVRNAFSNAVGGIKTIWSKLKEAVRKPIAFVVNTVFNKGIVPFVNRIPFIPGTLHTIPGWDTGGYTGRGGKYEPAGIVHRDEYVIRKESRQNIEGQAPGFLDRLNKRGAEALEGFLPGYARGGPVGGATGRVIMDGNQVSGIAARQIRLMERLANVNFRVMQGGYGGHHIRASGTSHNYSGVVDLAPASIAYEKLARQVGFAAWARNIGGRSRVGSGAHIHAVSLLDPGDARSPQVYGSWAGHRTGLNGGGRDPAPHYAWLPNLRKLLGNIPLANLGGGGGGGGLGYSGPSVGDVRSALNPGKWLGALRGMGPAGRWIGGMVSGAVGKLRGILVDKVKAAVRTLGRAVTGGAGPTSGPVSQTVRRAANTLGWGQGDQWNALSRLIQSESSWNPRAENPTSTASGLFQFIDSTARAYGLPGHASRFSVEAQTRAGLNYIRDRYHDPIGAWAYHRRHGTYDLGGIASRPGYMVKNTLKPERVLSPRQTESFDRLVAILERGGVGGPTVHIDTVNTRDDKAAAYAIRQEQMKATALMRLA